MKISRSENSKITKKTQTSRAVVLSSPNQLTLTKKDIPNVKNGMILDIYACGVCGTDPHIISGSRQTNLPIIPGHEFYGSIVDKTTCCGVHSVKGDAKVGDLVTVIPGRVCGVCYYCKNVPKEPQLCINRIAYGISMKADSYPFLGGGFADTAIIIDGFSVYPVPTDWPNGFGTLLEPFAVGVRAVQRALTAVSSFRINTEKAVIFGAGTIGISILRALIKKGIGAVVIEPLQHRCDLAKQLGAEAAISFEDIQNQPESLSTYFDGVGPVLIFEVAGTLEAFLHATSIIRRGGILIEVGNFADIGAVNLHPSTICRNDLIIIGSVLGPVDAYFEAEMLLSELVHFAPQLIAPIYPLDEFKAAIENVRNDKIGLKTVITP